MCKLKLSSFSASGPLCNFSLVSIDEDHKAYNTEITHNTI